MLDAFDLDYRSWSYWTWFLYAFAAYCIVGFVYFWFRFAALEAAAREGLPGQVERYRRALRGFPNAVFAKMMGKTIHERDQESQEPRSSGAQADRK